MRGALLEVMNVNLGGSPVLVMQNNDSCLEMCREWNQQKDHKAFRRETESPTGLGRGTYGAKSRLVATTALPSNCYRRRLLASNERRFREVKSRVLTHFKFPEMPLRRTLSCSSSGEPGQFRSVRPMVPQFRRQTSAFSRYRALRSCHDSLHNQKAP